MPHPDADDLALFAIGEEPAPELAAHVVSCAQCTAEVARWRETSDLARQADLPGWVPPAPAGVWAGVAAQLGLPAAGEDLPDTQATTLYRPSLEPPIELDERRPVRRRRWVIPIAAALAGLVAGAAVVFAIQRPPSPTVEKSATLVGLPSSVPEVSPNQPIGDAELLAVDGRRELRVQAAALPPIPGSYEVWLIATPERMVSLGVLTDGAGTFTVPAGIDTTAYALVDISNEAADGDPTHSGDSIARGTLS